MEYKTDIRRFDIWRKNNTVGEMTFGELTVGEMAFGDLTFIEITSKTSN